MAAMAACWCLLGLTISLHKVVAAASYWYPHGCLSMHMNAPLLYTSRRCQKLVIDVAYVVADCA